MTPAKAQARADAGNDLTGFFEQVLATYRHARAHDTMDSIHGLWTRFKEAQVAVGGLAPVSKCSKPILKWSIGQGVWAKIPWIALLDSRETRFTNDGVYARRLFDVSG